MSSKHEPQGAATDHDEPQLTHIADSGDGVTINYYGLGPSQVGFINDEAFRSLIRGHGYELQRDDGATVSADEPVTECGYLSVVDPSTGGRFYLLYDDESSCRLESPGFVEILKHMDDYCREHSKSRLFMAVPETDEEEDELDLFVDDGHPFFTLDFDYAAGRYVRC